MPLGKAQLGYSRQANRKANDGAHHADRDAQFEHINTRVLAALAAGQPVISVDTKRKEPIGNFRNGGTDYRPVGRSLTSRMAVVELIAATTTTTGLWVESGLDDNAYPQGIKVTNAEISSPNIQGDSFHPEWNYTIAPHPKTRRGYSRPAPYPSSPISRTHPNAPIIAIGAAHEPNSLPICQPSPSWH